jgi:hypothetical protein
MPHSHRLDYYIGNMNDESLADALADFEDPLDGRSADLLTVDLSDDFDDGIRLDYDDY